MAISKFQKFEAFTIRRVDIQNAPYNPRKIGDKEQKALRESLKTHGLVETLVWNKKTGNLVGGHQRLAQLDVLEKSDNYELTVAVVNLPEKQERELNIALNNPSMQGEYDIDLLKALLPEIDIANTGFSEYDLSILGVESDLDEMEEPDNTKKTKSSIEDIKEAKKRSLEKNIGTGENYIVVTFSSVEAKESFLDRMGHEADDRYMKGEILVKKLFADEKTDEDTNENAD
jgi:hypothetical protein